MIYHSNNLLPLLDHFLTDGGSDDVVCESVLIALRFEAPLVMKGKKFGKELKFMLGAEDAAKRDGWVDAFMTTEIEEDEAHAHLHEKDDDAVSHFDFEVTVKGQVATLSVTKESLKSNYTSTQTGNC